MYQKKKIVLKHSSKKQMQAVLIKYRWKYDGVRKQQNLPIR